MSVLAHKIFPVLLPDAGLFESTLEPTFTPEFTFASASGSSDSDADSDSESEDENVT